MIMSFGCKATEEIYHGLSTKASRSVPIPVWTVARRKLDMLNAAHVLDDLANHHSIRVNAQYRIIFRWEDGHAFDVQIIDYH
jgi:proteic killer suppression protein